MVGRWVSFWVLAYFQGRAVKLRGGKRSTKSGDVFSFKFRKRNMFKPLRRRKKPRKQRARPRVLFCFPAMEENFSSVQKGWVFGKENSLPLCETKSHEVLWFFWNQLWHDPKNGCLTWDILRAAVLLRFPNFNFWNDFGPVGNRKKSTPRMVFFHSSFERSALKMNIPGKNREALQKDVPAIICQCCLFRSPIWVFPKIGVPQNWWFTMESPIKMDDLGVPLFSETSIFDMILKGSKRSFLHMSTSTLLCSCVWIFSSLYRYMFPRTLTSRWSFRVQSLKMFHLQPQNHPFKKGNKHHLPKPAFFFGGLVGSKHMSCFFLWVFHQKNPRPISVLKAFGHRPAWERWKKEASEGCPEKTWFNESSQTDGRNERNTWTHGPTLLGY